MAGLMGMEMEERLEMEVQEKDMEHRESKIRRVHTLPQPEPTISSRVGGSSTASNQGSKGAASTVPRKRFTQANEEAGDLFTNRALEPLPQQTALLAHHFHLSLAACTAAATRYMCDNPGAVKYEKLHGPSGTKITVFDPSLFPSEERTTPEDWHDAWRNIMQIVQEFCDAEILARFKDHYLWLCRGRRLPARSGLRGSLTLRHALVFALIPNATTFGTIDEIPQQATRTYRESERDEETAFAENYGVQ
ncbi:hypothetical protein BXZ70DRAFT_1067219 [Cristinia sonorae]|uniref:Uncharacterized protein n=1 Tax=Cristinia sonorae TaxID=1940300 RepID=A0A8K0UHH9_9AGAR|nr:hypothetical protein BXZ70DRAFT_1067219 [Cristinia sonorae]